MKLSYLQGKLLPVVELYFYRADEDQEREQVRQTYQIPEEYTILGKTTDLGDILIFHKGKIKTIDHEEPLEKPYVIVKDLVKFAVFVENIEQYFGFSEEEQDIKRLKSLKKELKRLQKLAPKRLRHHFEEPIYDLEDLIEDLQ